MGIAILGLAETFDFTMKYPLVLFLAVCAFVLASCKKQDPVTLSDNTIPDYSAVPTILIQNYVNRLYIDLIGREPTDTEMDTDVQLLKDGGVSNSARLALIAKLMNDESDNGSGLSYKESFYTKFYNDQKGRYLNGSSESDLYEDYFRLVSIAQLDSLNNNELGYQVNMLEANKVKAVMDSRTELMNGSIQCNEMCWRMMFCVTYDDINMGTFNFINASFDNSLGRFPTEAELNGAFNAVENNISGELFGVVISSKVDFLNVLTNSYEFKEGLVRWLAQSLLARESTSAETVSYMTRLGSNFNFISVQQSILSSDEYAGFN
jgi:hypothetical protein